MKYNIKTIRQQFKAKGVFYSDSALAELLKSFMPENINEVYDPTCGDGGLLSVFPNRVRKYGQELNPEQAEVAKSRLNNAEIAVGDTLEKPVFLNKRFRAIVANPPFSIKWDEQKSEKSIFEGAPCLPPPSKADFAFLLHIVHCLAYNGVAAVVCFPGICYRGQREGRLRRWLVERNLIDMVFLIEGGHFVDTKIATVILVLRKNKETTSILMRDNALDLEREVSIEEIRANGYTLNVSSYISPPQPERPPVNPLELEDKARLHAISKLRAEIQFSLMVARMEGWSIEPFLDEIHDVVNEFREQPTIF